MHFSMSAMDLQLPGAPTRTPERIGTCTGVAGGGIAPWRAAGGACGGILTFLVGAALGAHHVEFVATVDDVAARRAATGGWVLAGGGVSEEFNFGHGAVPDAWPLDEDIDVVRGHCGILKMVR